MQRINGFYFMMTGLVLFLLACGNTPKNNEEQQDVDSLQTVVDTTPRKSFVYTKYKLPLSVDIYHFLETKEVEFNGEYIHSLDKKDKYFTEISKALILGVYASDLAYATINNKSQKAVDYFSVVIDLAHDLNIQQGYDSETMDRAYVNIDDDDSLSTIASQAYLETCLSLEKNNKVHIMPFIVLGSWVESVYILSQVANDSIADVDVFNELYVQKENLDGLINYLNDVKAELSGSELRELKAILKNLDVLKVKYTEITPEIKETLSIEQLKDIIARIGQLRKRII